MSKKKAAYLRGFTDGQKEAFQFLQDVERSLYAIELTMETTMSMSHDMILEKINIVRRAIDEYRDGVNRGEEIPDYMKMDNQYTRVRTIMDLQEGENTFLDAFDTMNLIDKKTMKFLEREQARLSFDEE